MVFFYRVGEYNDVVDIHLTEGQISEQIRHSPLENRGGIAEPHGPHALFEGSKHTGSHGGMLLVFCEQGYLPEPAQQVDVENALAPAMVDSS